GILTDQEGEELRADLLRDFGTTSPGKVDLSPTVTKLRIAGDARVRYQYDNEQVNGNTTAGSQDRSRYRYRMRLGFTANLGPKWSTGVRFETNGGTTSTNNDFGAGTDNFSKASGPDSVFLGQVFIQYNDIGVIGSDELDLRVGKFSHKFFNPGVNGFWIDSDINFEGVAEELVYENAVGSADLALRAGQFVLNANSTAGSNVNSPSTLFITQAELSNVSAATKTGWRIAPSFVAFAAPSNHDAGFTTPATQANDVAIYTDLATVLIPAEYSLLLKNGLPLAFYGTYGVNLAGDDRSDRLYGAEDPASYDQMFNLGVRYGAAKLAGEYALTAEYRYVEAGAYSSILLDSDFNAGRLGGAGPIVSGTYNFTEAVSGTITYFNSFNIDADQPPSGPTSTSGLGYGKAQVLQIDLSAKF
ncbi:MAG: putative porin, partial [Burkholderiales bacterium]|nr:putative porin [Opitutaceae bacterium]